MTVYKSSCKCGHDLNTHAQHEWNLDGIEGLLEYCYFPGCWCTIFED